MAEIHKILDPYNPRLLEDVKVWERIGQTPKDNDAVAEIKNTFTIQQLLSEWMPDYPRSTSIISHHSQKIPSTFIMHS